MRHIAILGSTGSIGESTLDVVRAHPDRLSIAALAAGRNRETFLAQVREFRPDAVSLASKEDADWLRSEFREAIEIHWGPSGLLACALHGKADTVMAAVVGAAGLESVEAALRAGRRVCVANKESLVAGGGLMQRAKEAGRAELLPVDSEHAALHQLLSDRHPGSIREVRITASGGPFRTWPLERLKTVAVEEALNHPTWKMGPKITIDSATLMNKGLEIIEATVLFGLKPDQVAVTVHAQSQVHAMVGFTDGSYQLQVSANDMKHPIQYCLLHPDKVEGPLPPYDWNQARTWTFEPPDLQRFPCLGLAYAALRTGGTAPAVLSAANEVAVEAFLQRRMAFLDIPACVEDALQAFPSEQLQDLAHLLDADRRARRHAERWAASRAR